MEVTIGKDELYRAVSRVQNIIEKRSNMPILSMILVSAENGEIHISATDLEISLQQKIPAEVLTPGSITISGRKLFEILKETKSPKIFMKEKENNWVFVSDDQTKYNLACLPADEYPIFVEPEGVEIGVVADEALAGEYWVGCYIKLSNPFTGVDLQNFRLFGFGAAAWEVMLRAYYTTASGWQWYLTRPAGGTTTATALSSFNLGQWYWVETHLKRSSGGAATDGDCHVWVDDVLVHDQNDYDNNPPASTNLSNARITLDNIDVGTAGTVYYDHFVLSNEGRIYRTKRNLLTGVFGGPIR